MSTEGIIAYECFTGTLDSSRFFDFVRGTLIAQMHSFDGSSPQSILIMDNCSVHHVQEIQDLLASVGIPLIYLPPYSPDHNPLEEAFSFINKYLKQHDELTLTVPHHIELCHLGNHCNVVMSSNGSLPQTLPYQDDKSSNQSSNSDTIL